MTPILPTPDAFRAAVAVAGFHLLKETNESISSYEEWQFGTNSVVLTLRWFPEDNVIEAELRPLPEPGTTYAAMRLTTLAVTLASTANFFTTLEIHRPQALVHLVHI